MPRWRGLEQLERRLLLSGLQQYEVTAVVPDNHLPSAVTISSSLPQSVEVEQNHYVRIQLTNPIDQIYVDDPLREQSYWDDWWYDRTPETFQESAGYENGNYYYTADAFDASWYAGIYYPGFFTYQFDNGQAVGVHSQGTALDTVASTYSAIDSWGVTMESLGNSYSTWADAATEDPTLANQLEQYAAFWKDHYWDNADIDGSYTQNELDAARDQLAIWAEDAFVNGDRTEWMTADYDAIVYGYQGIATAADLVDAGAVGTTSHTIYSATAQGISLNLDSNFEDTFIANMSDALSAEALEWLDGRPDIAFAVTSFATANDANHDGLFDVGDFFTALRAGGNGAASFVSDQVLETNDGDGFIRTIWNSSQYGQVTVAIRDASPKLSVSQGQAAIEGSQNGIFTITTPTTFENPVEVNYTIYSASDEFRVAEADVDYTALSGSFTFPANTNSYQISFTTIDDELKEPNELVTMTLQADTGDPPAFLMGTASASVTIYDDDNSAPVIDEMSVPSTSVEAQSVSFSASASDVDTEQTLTYTWDFGDGQTGTGSSVTHTYADNPSSGGPYTVTLTVDDGYDKTDTQTAEITVSDVEPTIVVSGAASVDEGSTYTLTLGAVTDPGNDTVTQYRINWGNDETSTGSYTGEGQTVDYIYPDGDLSPTITVDLYDDDGWHTTTAGKAITVDNVVPSMSVTGAASIDEGSTYTLNLGAVTDPGDDTVSQYIVDWGDGQSDTYLSGGDKTHDYVNGDANVTIIVDLVDDDGTHSAVASKAVTVNNVAPVVLGTLDAAADEGDSIDFSASFSDVGADDTFTYEWDFGDGNTESGSTGTQGALTTSHSYGDNGTYTVTLTVTDDDGDSDVITGTVTIANVAPTVSVGDNLTIQMTDPTVDFSGSFIDPGADDTHTISWTFGDGESASGSLTPSHTYAQAGTYTVTLTVTDDDGGTDSATRTITVEPIWVVDDDDAAMTTTGSWFATGAGYINGSLWAATGTGDSIATWAFSDLPTGKYKVYATWFSGNRATNAPYGLYEGALQLNSRTINQRTITASKTFDNRSWELLDTIAVTGSSMSVKLTNDSNGIVSADAVLVERIADLDAGGDLHVVYAGNEQIDGVSTIDFGSSLYVGDTTTRTVTVRNQGAGMLNLSNLTAPAGFELVSGFGDSSLASGQSTTFVVRMGNTPGTYDDASLTFTTDDEDESSFELLLDGSVASVWVVDNSDGGFSAVGSWGTIGQGYNNSSRWAQPDSNGSRTATWNFSDLSAGVYNVYATWFVGNPRATDAPFKLYDGSTQVNTVDVNQGVEPADLSYLSSNWKLLDDVAVTGTSLKVQLTSSADAIVSADAILIERTGNLASGGDLQLSYNGVDLAHNSGTVDFGTASYIGDYVTRTITVRNQGTSTLNLDSLTPPSGFTVSSTFGDTSLDSGQTTTFTLQMGDDFGTFTNQTVSIGSNDDSPSTFNFLISGEVDSTWILDNSDAGFTSSGTWYGAGTGYGSGSIWAYPHSAGIRTGTWTFSSLPTGKYNVYATWFNGNRATDAPYALFDNTTQLDVVDVDQSQAPSDRTVKNTNWDLLGEVALTSSTLKVQLSSDADGILSADAILIERMTDLTTGGDAQLICNGLAVDHSTGQVDFGTAAFVGDTQTRTFTVRNQGAGALSLSTLNPPSGFVTQSNFGSTSLSSGQTTTFTIAMGADDGTFTDSSLSFFTNESGQTTYTALLSGTVEPIWIVDNADGGFSLTGPWSSANAGYNGTSKWTYEDNGIRFATWNFTGLDTGKYNVYATWFTGAQRASNAPYTLYDGVTQVNQVQVNQGVSASGKTVDSTGWKLLDQVAVTGSSMKVIMGAEANNIVSADAILIERVSDLDAGGELQIMYEGADLAHGVGSVDYGTSEFIGDTVTKTYTVRNQGAGLLTLSGITPPSGFTVSAGFGDSTLISGQTSTFRIAMGATDGTFSNQTLAVASDDADQGTFNTLVSGTVNPIWILDNLDPEFNLVGAWSTANNGYQDHTYWTYPDSGIRSGTWTFSDLSSGRYNVYATWFVGNPRATDAPYTLYDGSNQVDVIDMDQSGTPSDKTVDDRGWALIDELAVTGSSMKVKVGAVANNIVTADAVLIERTGDLEAGGDIQLSYNGIDLAHGSGSVDFGTADYVGDTVTRSITVRNQGAGTLNLTGLTPPAGFTVASGFGDSSLTSGQTTTFDIAMGDTAGVYTNQTMAIDSDDADRGTFNLLFSGVVQPIWIKDNADAGFTKSGEWYSTNNGYGNQSWWAFNDGGVSTATWTYSGLVAGDYKVYATWFAGDRATNAPFSLYNGAALSSTVSVNQTSVTADLTVDGTNWELLGTVSVTGDTLKVILAANANGIVSADGIVIQKIEA